MQDDLDTRKLNAIVGSAIKAMAESGASDELVGSFAASQREKVAAILGMSTLTQPVPDLSQAIAQGVKAALEQIGFARPSREKSQRVTVFVSGRKTTVTISESLLAKLADQSGGLSKARALIAEIAQSAPEGLPNRSAWIEGRITGISTTSLNTALSSDPSLRH